MHSSHGQTDMVRSVVNSFYLSIYFHTAAKRSVCYLLKSRQKLLDMKLYIRQLEKI